MAKNTIRYALAIDTRKCINCKACSVACRAEHQVPMEHSRNWITEELRGAWPALSASFIPEQCHHCGDPACVRVCPTGASRQRADGIVVVDEKDCVGCRYCVLACPYEARYFDEDRGVVDKCTFCAERVDKGRPPACVETCPGKVRVFGNLHDPRTRIAKLLAARPHTQRKPEAGSDPQIYYAG